MLTEQIIKLFRQSKRIIVFTGAGMSTDSGIPDFRSKEGLYQLAPETILSKRFFFDKPNIFYDFFFENIYHPESRPNIGHEILSKWEKSGRTIDIITQNIDGLHIKAGSSKVVEFHGTVHTATCYNPKCRKTYTTSELFERSKNKKDFFICDCGKASTKRYIKPDVILFDEAGKWMSSSNLYDIRQRVWKADLVLVLGSSLQVYPFRSFIDNKPTIKPMVIINKDYVFQEKMTNTYSIHNNISEVLTEVDLRMN